MKRSARPTDPATARIAFCIECHRHTPVLEALIVALEHPCHEIFVHVDGKTPLGAFAPLRGRVRFVTPRSKVYWGDFAQIACMLTLLRAVRAAEKTGGGEFAYTLFLSGDTLPLHPVDALRRQLLARHPDELLTRMAPWLDIREMKSKLLRMHYYDKTTLRRRLQRLAAKLLRPMRNPLFGELPPLEKGPNWFALTAPARDWALDYLDAHPRYTEAFRHSRCGDEIFFHTLLLASPFARRCCRHAPLIYTEWPADTASAHPLPLGDEAVDRLRAVRDGDDAPLFARKIDERIDLGRYARLLLGGN